MKFTHFKKTWFLLVPLTLCLSLNTAETQGSELFTLLSQMRLPANQLKPDDLANMDRTNEVTPPTKLADRYALTYQLLGIAQLPTDNSLSKRTLLESQLLYPQINPAFFDSIDGTITTFGSAMLSYFLSLPKPREALEHTQKAIKLCNKHTDFSTQATTTLQQTNRYLQTYFRLWQDENRGFLNKTLYYDDNGVMGGYLGLSNIENPWAHQASYLGDRAMSATYVAGALAIGKFLKNYTENSFKDPIKTAAKLASQNGIIGVQALVEDETVNKMLAGGSSNLTENLWNNKGKAWNYIKNLSALEQVGLGGITIVGAKEGGSLLANKAMNIGNMGLNFIKKPYDWEKNASTALTYAHKQLIDMGHIARQIKALNDLLVAHPDIAKHLTYAKFILGLFDPASKDVSPNMRKLFELLLTNTFTGVPSWFSYKGRIMAAYKLMQECMVESINPFIALGEIDAYLSCATLHEQTKGSATPFNFVHYESSTQPAVHITGLWNPISPKMTLPQETISFGGGNNNTTVSNIHSLRSAVLAVIMGNTLGMAPARSMKMTPAATIETLMNPQTLMDNVSDVFATCQEKNKLHTPVFIAVDGTHNNQSSEAINNIVDRLTMFKNVGLIVAKHESQTT